MSCRKRFLFIPFLCFFFSVFFSFILEKNSFAVSPYSFTLDSSSQFPTSSVSIIPSDCDSNCRSQYHYVSIDAGSLSGGRSPSCNFYFNNAYYFTVQPFNNHNFFFGSSDLSFTDLRCYSTYSIADSYVITLYDSFPNSIVPSGTLPITSNGQFDVTQYEYVDVNVANEVIQGDYHDDLVSIKHAIITCGGVILVLYFFYCIYRMIIKNSGVH